MESAGIQDADKMVKWHMDDDEAVKKWRAAGNDEKDRKKTKKPSKTAVCKSDCTAFRTACFEFIQSQKMNEFIGMLPMVLNADRLFAMVLLEGL